MERLQSPRSRGGELETQPSPTPGFWAHEAEALAGAAVERRRQSPVRFFILLLVATATATSLNVPGVREWLWSWTIGNFAVQSMEIAVLWRFRPGQAPVDAASVTVGLLATAAVSLGFDLGALILWRTPGMLGPAAALLLVTAGLMNVTAISRGSALAFAAAAAPHVFLLLFGPVIASGAILHDPMFPVLTGASFVLCVAMVTVWRRGERLSRTHVEARALADRRRAEAEAATEAKSRYAAAVSHELRTPLTAILAVAAETERHAQSDWGRQNAQLVGEAGRMMRRLLDDLLDLAKIEAGHMGVEALAFSPRSLLEDVRRFWAAEAAAAHIELVLDGAEAAPARALGDPTRLRQVLNNLISNAVKFTPNGRVRMIASTIAIPGGGVRLTVEVVDNGRGVPADQIERLFTPFHRAHGSCDDANGTGLGLAISRELARLMGGDIVAASSPQGSRFTLTVSLAAAPAGSETSLASAEAAAENNLPSMRLLVVDDQPMVRRAVGLLLQPLGLVTEYADSGSDALRRLTSEPFDLVLMDVNMADLDGLETTRRLRRSNGPNRDTPVLAVTGAMHEGAAESYLACGMNGFIAKPLEPKPFYAALESAFAREAA